MTTALPHPTTDFGDATGTRRPALAALFGAQPREGRRVAGPPIIATMRPGRRGSVAAGVAADCRARRVAGGSLARPAMVLAGPGRGRVHLHLHRRGLPAPQRPAARSRLGRDGR